MGLRVDLANTGLLEDTLTIENAVETILVLPKILDELVSNTMKEIR